MRGKPGAQTPPAGLALPPGLQRASGFSPSHSALEGQFQLAITGCVEGTGQAGNAFRESCPVSLSTQGVRDTHTK